MQIDIEEATLETRQKKGGGSYQVQIGYVHTVDRSGNPNRYPEKIALFPQRTEGGEPIPYKPGKYRIGERCFRVNNGFLELGFLQLEPVK